MKRPNLTSLALFACLSFPVWAQMRGIAPVDPPPPELVDTVKFDSTKGPDPLPDDLSLMPTGYEKPSAGVEDLHGLARVAVLHEGRVKPFETFARHILLQLSGKRSFEGRSAVATVAEVLFAPESTVHWKIFLINNPEVAQGMGIAEEKHRHYSLKELQKGLHKLQTLVEKASKVPDAEQSLTDKEFLRVWSNVFLFVQLGHTLEFAMPSPSFSLRMPESRAALGLDEERTKFSFWELMAHAPAIARVLEGVGNRPPDERSGIETEVIAVSQAMFLNSQTNQPSPFKPIPPLADEGMDWLSPSEAVAHPEKLQAEHSLLDLWVKGLQAYRGGDQKAFDSTMAGIGRKVEDRAPKIMAGTRFGIELPYQRIDPHFKALMIYWLALIGCFTFFLLRKRWIYRATLAVFLIGFLFHVGGILARILIMHRPPVSSLYETFPFVAAVAILASLVLEKFNRRGIGLLAASILGVILLSIANRYAAEGDTLKMLVAVLNSNFWLSTHVICITIGYSACLLCGALGHVWLVRALLPGGQDKPERLKEIQKMIYGTLGFGLLFSFIGTVLGGIWADQSWGRFWGWDPKENGALLIVIWCVILFHARWWGRIRDLGMALGAVFGAIVVSLAWFGVNLLNVGLHSYGFTSGTAFKLFAYVAGELVFILVTGIWIKRRQLTKP